MNNAAIALVLALIVTPAGAQAQEVRTSYFLPKSVISVSGTITTKNTFPGVATDGMIQGGSVDFGQLSIALTTVPDPAMPLVLLSESALLSKNTLSVELTSGGVLSAVNIKSEGMLGGIVKNIFGAAVSIAKVAGGLLMSSQPVAEQMYEREHSNEAKRRAQLKLAIQDATARLIDVEAKAVAEDKELARKALKERISSLKDSLANLREQLALADAHYAAWKSRLEDAKERRIEHLFDVDELPVDEPVRALAASTTGVTLDQVTKAAGEFAAITKETRVIVTQGTAVAKNTTVAPNTASAGVTYRSVRPVVLSIYMLDGLNRPVLSKQSLEFVTGAASPIASIAVHNAKWSTKSVGLVFTNGTLTKLSSEAGSELAGAAEAIRGVPAEYLGTLKQANEIIAERNKLGVSGLQGQIDELKKQKELTEARIASGESGDLAAMQAETARLDAELKLLTSQRALAGSQGVGADSASLTLLVQITKLQNDLAEAQMKQIELQQKLEELRRKTGGTP